MVAPTSSANSIERGVTNPSLEILLRLANQLNVPVGQLLLPPVDAL
jgi:transcriptional regulator with XRE-family HTH domain